MKKMILSLAAAGAIAVTTSACNSTKNMSNGSDSTSMDSTMMPMDMDTTGTMDTTTTMPDTTTMPPDTTALPQ